MRQRNLPAVVVLALPFCLAMLGCGGSSDAPELEPVEGTVTFGGQPVVGATVEFVPVKGGDTSRGRTDEQGHYKLFRSGDSAGAKAGDYTVRIQLPSAGDDQTPGSVKQIPAKYNSKTTLKATVTDGQSDPIDFTLTP